MKKGMKIFGLIRKYWSLTKRNDKPKPRSWDEYVIRSILATNEFGISEVFGLQSIKSMYLEREKYPLIVALIKEKNLAALIEMPGGNRHPTFQEDLEIMQFQNQSGLKFIVTVYDSDELWQNPQIIEIFPIS